LTVPARYAIFYLTCRPTGFFCCANAENRPAPEQGGTAHHGRIQQGGAEKMAADARVKITLRCNECKQRNYNTKKNKKNTSDKVELKKYCRFCRKHTVHTEAK
jgi:large subunit ribosomal protein L33